MTMRVSDALLTHIPPCHGSPSQGRARNRARQRGCAGSQGKHARRMAHKLLRAQTDGRLLAVVLPRLL